MAGATWTLHGDRGRRAIFVTIRLVAAVFAGQGAIGAARADGEPSRPIADAIELGPSRCLEKQRLADQIGEWLGRADIDARIAIDVVEAPEEVRFVVRRGAQRLGERKLPLAHVRCDEVSVASALAITAALEAILRDAPEAPPLAPFPPADTSPRVAVDEPARASPAVGVARSTLGVSLVGMGLFGVLPGFALGVAPGVEARVGTSVDLRASALVTSARTVPFAEGEGEARLFALRVDVCAAHDLTRGLRIRGCGALVAGTFIARGIDLAGARSSTSPWISPALHGDIVLSLGDSFAIVAGGDGFFPAVRPEFQRLGAEGQVIASRRFPAVGGSLSLGPWLRF